MTAPIIRIAALGVLLWIVGAIPVRTDARRLPHLDDFFRMEGGMASTTFAPDGRSVAYVRSRPESTLPPSAKNGLVAYMEHDVWLQDGPGMPVRNLTNGAKDASGWWAPQWSPDGKRLAFLSTRGGSITLWAWERSTNAVRQLSQQGVRFHGMEGSTGYTWIDANRLLLLSPAKGEASLPETSEGHGARLAVEAWTKAARGESTASPIDSLQFEYPKRALMVLDAATGRSQQIAETSETMHTLETGRGPASSTWVPAPDGRTVVVPRPGPLAYNTSSRMRIGNPRSIELRLMTGELLQLKQPLPENVHMQTLQWSPDGKELAFFANGSTVINPVQLYGVAAADVMSERSDTWGNPAQLYRVNVVEKTLVRLDTGDIDLGDLGSPSFQWTASGELLFRVPRRQFGVTAGPPAWRGAPWGWTSANATSITKAPNREWFVLDRNGRTRPLVPNASTLPQALQALQGRTEFVGVADGDLWMIDPLKGTARNLTGDFTPAVAQVTIPTATPVKRLVLGLAPPAGARRPRTSFTPHALELESGQIVPLKAPADGASLVALDPLASSAVYSTDSGTVYWRVSHDGQPEQLFEINAFLRNMVRPECKTIDYTSLNGSPLKGWLCLPIDYQPGRRYPLVSELRMAVMVNDNRFSGEGGPAPWDIYTASGYAYLVPSMPRDLPGRDREEGDQIVMVPNGVMPAVEKVIEMGIADPGRLFLTGGSRGGWSTLSLVGLTNRFKAAVSSSYGWGAASGTPEVPDFQLRYTENPMDLIIADGWNKGYKPSALPWWRDGDWHRRNDPLSYADRVQTPLLLIHGDLDRDNFGKTEQYFLALVSMRKPAQFVRYWGEGHGNRTPANIRDKWARVLAWFDKWGDIARDSDGKMIFENGQVSSRKNAPALTPEDFAKFGPTSINRQVSASR